MKCFHVLRRICLFADIHTPEYPTDPAKVRQLSNYALTDIVTPVNAQVLKSLLEQSNYDPQETAFLYEGFTKGFKLGYQGPRNVKINSRNLKFRIGDKFDLWDKIMTEVEAKRYAGPYESPEQISPNGYIVNGCGLVEKAGGKTRMIHHYSHPPGASVNDFIPDSYAKVQYQDFQYAILITLNLLEQYGQESKIFYTKTDAQHAFRVLCIAVEDRPFQLLKATNPVTGKLAYFADLCCGFGSRSSCFLYDKLSRCLRHLYRYKSGIDGVVYLDDGLQIGFNETNANGNLAIYLDLCRQINLPISEDKTVWATQVIVFLGLLINAAKKIITIPEPKLSKALNQIDFIIGAKKVTVLDMQRITGLLNFFCKAIVPGRAFTRRLYAMYSGENKQLKQHHHVRVTSEVRLDLGMWRRFIVNNLDFSRPFVDFDKAAKRTILQFTSDAAKATQTGFATCFQFEKVLYYCFDRWERQFLEQYDPSIQFLELYGSVCGILLFSKLLRNSRVTIFCDNQAVMHMLNKATSACKHCMILIRLVTLTAMEWNMDYEVKYVSSADNTWSDLLLRQKFALFKREVPAELKLVRLPVPKALVPQEKIYNLT